MRTRVHARSYLNNNQLSGSLPSSVNSLTGLQYMCVHCVAIGLLAQPRKHFYNL